MNTQIFEYNGNRITFNTGDSVMVNATEMAKPFNRRVNDWINLPSTKRFIEVLSNTRNSGNWIETQRGQHTGGTWVHEDVALEFARWLSPEFGIWCNDRIKELMRYGITATPLAMEKIIKDPDFGIELLNQVKKERVRAELAESTIQQQAPKVKYHDDVLTSESNHTTTTIAKELGMSGKALHKKLNLLGVMYKHDNHWVLYAKYQNKGYTDTRTHPFYDVHGELRTKINTVWTEEGRKFIHELMGNQPEHQLIMSENA